MTIVYLSDFRSPPQVNGTLTHNLARMRSLTALTLAGTIEAAGAMRAFSNKLSETRECLREAAQHHDRCMAACDLRDLEDMIRARDAIREEMGGYR